MSGFVIENKIKQLENDIDKLHNSILTNQKAFKDLDSKKNHKEVKAFIEKTKLTGNTSGILSNHKNSEKFIKLSDVIVKFLKENNKVQYDNSDIPLENEDRTLTIFEEQQIRFIMIKKGYDFCQSLLRYATVNIRNAKTDKENTRKGKEQKSISICQFDFQNNIFYLV
ncbi:hypothetical protein ABPG72_006774 [Tetrahymena utriculariae]